MSPTSRRKVEGSLEKDQWDSIRSSVGGSKGATLISVDTLKNEEEDHSCNEGSDRRVSAAKDWHYWPACYSICLGPRSEKLFMVPQLASQHTTAAYQRGLQQVCTTCQPVKVQLTWNTQLCVVQGKILYIKEVVSCVSHTDEHFSFALCLK